MANELWAQTVLDGVRTRLSSRLPVMIDKIATGGGIEVADPAAVEVRSDIDSVTALPHVALVVESEILIERRLGLRLNLQIPLEVFVTAQPASNFTTPDAHLTTYERALVLAMTEPDMTSSVTGLFWVELTGTGPLEDVNGKDRHRRRTSVRCNLHVRTTRLME